MDSQKWYWTGNPRKPINLSEEVELNRVNHSWNKSEFFEHFKTTSKPGIQIKGLTKKFGEKAAVKDLNLDMFEDEVFGKYLLIIFDNLRNILII